ncbi:MAG: chromosomal replication initiator protein [Parcubacteria group bacterium Gr01-1014_18]|nr:MAG: chromosomal replication initiator protein [Parcubacteria group bacterium Greene0416_36]TSC81157.1 MAG: chromosomal replication initiator protein [Parcubacteria group bacterium Gr01-1014_18]TSC99154.1 MAG: chromosomal replication initiator protein [Parcubacteria group bacterium Greene1014_20]TSD07488.1 MAG: chromosomal replication initiator protein [Parcubacteria group bacterium Greene0714_2]
MDIQRLWQAVLGELELTISKPNFTTWFKHTGISSVENGKVTIGVPNTFTQAWMEQKYHQYILKAFQKLTENELREVTYRVEQSSVANNTRNVTSPAQTAPVPAAQEPVQYAEPQKQEPKNEFGINNKYTFSTFIVGKSNELAHAAAQAISKRPGEVYNPLFIYGGVGLGKTHIMQAVGHEIKQNNPNVKILYASCEKFTNDYINMIKTGRGKEFQDIYRSVDLLLMDDIQFITGKEGTQEAFFHTFNTLHNQNKQIIITSDRPPKAIPTLEARLQSRFEWGMIVDIQNPDLETRLAILDQKCGEKKYQLSLDIIKLIAVTVQSNIRELEGALNRVIAHHQLQGISPTIASTKNILATLTSTYPKKSITPKQIVSTVIQFYDITLEQITGSSRKKELVIPRQIVMFLMRQEIDSSYPTIGEELGGRDHTTAMHACEKIKREVDNNEKMRQEISLIRQRLYNEH